MEHEPTEQLYWDLDEELDQVQRQLLFVLKLWHERDENYARVADVVYMSAMGVRKRAREIEDSDDRQEILRKAGRVLSVISFHNEYPPYVQGSGGQRPAPPKGRIRSVTPGGLPGLGKWR